MVPGACNPENVKPMSETFTNSTDRADTLSMKSMAWTLALAMHWANGRMESPGDCGTAANASSYSEDPAMKRYLAVALVAFALALAAPSAFAVRVRVVDPPGSLTTSNPFPDCVSSTPCNIYYFGTTYHPGFVSCLHPPAGPINPAVDTAGFSFCLWLNNKTGAGASQIDFDLTVPTGAGGAQLQCDSDDPNTLVAIQCPSFLPADGSSFGMTFLSTPALGDGRDFYLLTDFETDPGSAGVTLSATSVPEPGELGLFGLGLLAIGGAYSLQRRRQRPGMNGTR